MPDSLYDMQMDELCQRAEQAREEQKNNPKDCSKFLSDTARKDLENIIQAVLASDIVLSGYDKRQLKELLARCKYNSDRVFSRSKYLVENMLRLRYSIDSLGDLLNHTKQS